MEYESQKFAGAGAALGNEMMAKQAYHNLANAATSAKPSTQSDSILGRLQYLRNAFMENRAMAENVTHKIIGHAPAPVNGIAGGIERGQPNGFMDAINDMLSELERVGSDTQQHLQRLNNAF